MNKNTIVFAYSQIGYDCLKFLLEKRVPVVGIFTHKPSPKENIWFDSVAKLGRDAKIPVFEDANLKLDETIQKIRNLSPALILSFYYRDLIPETILKIPAHGSFNMHGSLLPKYRGCAPVNWAILNGETETGVTLHEMVKKADAGDIIDQEKVAIEPTNTALEVMQKMCKAAVNVLGRQLPKLFAGTVTKHKQDDREATYFRRRTPEDGKIDWNQPAIKIYNLIRALTRPYPGAWADLPDNRRIYIWGAIPFQAQINVKNTPAVGSLLCEQPFLFQTGNGILQVTDCTIM